MSASNCEDRERAHNSYVMRMTVGISSQRIRVVQTQDHILVHRLRGDEGDIADELELGFGECSLPR